MSVHMSASRGLKMIGERAVTTLFRKYKQFHDMDIFDRVQIDDMSPGLKNKALKTIKIIKGKRNGDIKGEHVLMGTTYSFH